MQDILFYYLTRYLLSQDHKNLIQVLGKLECGFHDFCMKKSIQADVEGKAVLAFQLRKHAYQEDAHFKMLWSVIYDDRPKRKRNSQEEGITLENPEHFSDENFFEWHSKKDGKLKQWHFTRGISLRYGVTRAYFNHRQAEDHNWADTLAFMCVGELVGQSFYRALSNQVENPLRAILSKIAQDEGNHHQYLWDALLDEVGVRAYYYFLKWQLRKYKALFSIHHDIREITQRKTKSA